MEKHQKPDIDRLLEVVAKLRSPDGCPWDRKQTHDSLKPYLMEECAEFLDSVDEQDFDGMREELGDILLHVVLQAQMAEEQGRFTFDDVVETIVSKMLRRHPHVFGEVSVANADEVLDLWRELKKKEEKEESKSLLDKIPRHLPALMRAETIQKVAARAGFNWTSEPEILDKIEEELRELHQAVDREDGDAVEEEIGDLLFAVVSLSRFRQGPSAEELLARTIRKFQERYRYVESHLHDDGRKVNDSTAEELVNLWEQAKTAKD